MERVDFIEEFKRLVSEGKLTDIESYGTSENFSRGKKQKDLSNGDIWETVIIGKHKYYIKK